ncbi:hypothetical protein [Craterilacuibacter sinensis]|uniref:Uncharacterized protein n=1 Tax=Craterilacuibacter sinensis TaxID=2686017 RepID=A0A845BRY9_9NEIS|nr:hypothetical protein [Craterilacuibacter sinensis]MXR37994.1 hypothetical protein [Craterilacuibacter sinensis]
MSNLPMSLDGTCIAERAIQQIRRLPKKRVAVLVVNAKPSMRYVSTVQAGGREYLADRTTGTLYRTDDGRCLSSNRLRLDLSTLE